MPKRSTRRIVTAWQSATFDGGSPHAFPGAGAGPCDLIMTVRLPSGTA